MFLLQKNVTNELLCFINIKMLCRQCQWQSLINLMNALYFVLFSKDSKCIETQNNHIMN